MSVLMTSFIVTAGPFSLWSASGTTYHYCLEQALTYQPPGDPNQYGPYSPGQYPPPEPTAPMPGQGGGWPDPYRQPDPYGQPPTSGPAYGQPISGPSYGQPTSGPGFGPPVTGQPYGQPGGPGMPPPGGFGPAKPPSGGNGAMIGVIIAVVAVLILAVGIGGFFLIRSASNDAAGGGESSSAAESSSSSSESTTSALPSETTGGGTGGYADTAQTGDCLDYPSDPNDTVIVDCSDSSAHYEVLSRVDEPTSTENTDDAAAAECEGTGFDSTLYVLGASAADPFVLCLKTL